MCFWSRSHGWKYHKAPNPPSPSHTHFYLGECASTPTLSCLVLAARVKLTLSCGRLSQWTIWRRPLSSMIPITQQKKPHPFASDYTPGQRRGWGSYILLSGGGDFQGRDRGRSALNCPFIESLPFLSCWAGPKGRFPYLPRAWMVPLVVMFQALFGR